MMNMFNVYILLSMILTAIRAHLPTMQVQTNVIVPLPSFNFKPMKYTLCVRESNSPRSYPGAQSKNDNYCKSRNLNNLRPQRHYRNSKACANLERKGLTWTKDEYQYEQTHDTLIGELFSKHPKWVANPCLQEHTLKLSAKQAQRLRYSAYLAPKYSKRKGHEGGTTILVEQGSVGRQVQGPDAQMNGVAGSLTTNMRDQHPLLVGLMPRLHCR
eukprot:2408363-Amphidinium_carterae.2